MSYDIAVFDPRHDLRDRDSFLEWYDAVTEWEDELDYRNPANATPALQAWYREMIETFPPMNGPDQPPENDQAKWDMVADYSIARDIIYVACSFSKAERLYETMHRVAAKHGVGFFDASGSDGAAWFPVAGKLEVVHTEPEDGDA